MDNLSNHHDIERLNTSHKLIFQCYCIPSSMDMEPSFETMTVGPFTSTSLSEKKSRLTEQDSMEQLYYHCIIRI